MVEVALDLELLPQREVVAEVGAVGDRPTEALGEHVVAAERHLGDHAGDGQAVAGPVAGRGVVVVAAAPARVERDHPPADAAPGDLLRRRLHAGGDRHEARAPAAGT